MLCQPGPNLSLHRRRQFDPLELRPVTCLGPLLYLLMTVAALTGVAIPFAPDRRAVPAMPLAITVLISSSYNVVSFSLSQMCVFLAHGNQVGFNQTVIFSHKDKK